MSDRNDCDEKTQLHIPVPAYIYPIPKQVDSQRAFVIAVDVVL